MATIGLALVAVVTASVLLSAWFLVALPFLLAGMVAARLGLSNDEMLHAIDTWDDPGGGTAGLSP